MRETRSSTLWLLARYTSPEFSPEEKKVPGWTGFYHQVLTPNHNDNHLSKIFYLTSIHQLPIKIDAFQEVLCQVKEKSEALNKQEAHLVLDHAIHWTALEVIMGLRNLELNNFLNWLMGAFRASWILIASDFKQLDWKIFAWAIFDWHKISWQSDKKETVFMPLRLFLRL